MYFPWIYNIKEYSFMTYIHYIIVLILKATTNYIAKK